MKTINMTELKEGDIFCHELKLIGREAFKVIGLTEKQVVCESRTTKKIIKKQRAGQVIFLRHED